MASLDTLTLPLDQTSADDLAARGLEYARVDADGDGYRPFQRAVARGFLGGESTDDEAENEAQKASEKATTSRTHAEFYSDKQASKGDE